MSLYGRFTAAASQFLNRHGIYLGRRSTKIHVALYRLSKGRIGGHLPGWPKAKIALVDHVGAKSGRRRTSPLMYHEEGNVVAVVASKAGQPTNPAWFHNLMANPQTTIQIGAEVRDVRARVTDGEERERLWNEFVDFYPGYEFFREHAGDREIPIVVMESSAPASAARPDRDRTEVGTGDDSRARPANGLKLAPMRRGAIAFCLLLATLAAFPVAAAAAITFGANLGKAPNNTATCITIQVFPIYGPNCSIVSNNPTTGESSFPPAGEGIVSRVRVRVGPVTGPMQIAEEEALRKDNPADPGHPTYACCKLVALSPVFTPAPNSVTTVPVNFPVKQSRTPEPSGYYVDDHLSLSVLDGNVPIPAATDPGAGVGIWFPAWQSPGEERAGIYGTAGITVLFNADWDPVTGAAPGGGAAATGAALRLPRTARIANGRALLPLVCNLNQVCRGLLRLQNRAAGGGARLLAKGRGRGKKRRKKTITYASTAFRIPAGQRKVLRANLRRAGKRLLRRRPKARVWLNVAFRGTTATVPSKRVILRRKAGKRRR